MHNLLATPSFTPKTWRVIVARIEIVYLLLLVLTIFNPEIGSVGTANLIPTSCPSVIPPTLSAFGQSRFRSFTQTVSICKSTHNSAKTYRTGPVFPAACIPVSPVVPLPLFLSFSSTPSTRNSCRSFAGDGNRRKFNAPYKITTEYIRKMKQSPCVGTSVQFIFLRRWQVDSFSLLFRIYLLSVLFFSCKNKINTQMLYLLLDLLNKWSNIFSPSWKNLEIIMHKIIYLYKID